LKPPGKGAAKKLCFILVFPLNDRISGNPRGSPNKKFNLHCAAGKIKSKTHSERHFIPVFRRKYVFFEKIP